MTFLGRARGQLTITEQQAYARTRIEELEEIAAAVEARKGGELAGFEPVPLPCGQASAVGQFEHGAQRRRRRRSG